MATLLVESITPPERTDPAAQQLLLIFDNPDNKNCKRSILVTNIIFPAFPLGKHKTIFKKLGEFFPGFQEGHLNFNPKDGLGSFRSGLQKFVIGSAEMKTNWEKLRGVIKSQGWKIVPAQDYSFPPEVKIALGNWLQD